jgi:protein TonB
MKTLIGLFPGLAVAFVLFVVMSSIVAPPDGFERPTNESTAIDFVQRRQDSETEARSRTLPEPPQIPQVPTPAATNATQDMPQAPSLQMPPMSTDMALSGMSMMGDLLVGISQGDTEVMPLVRQPAIYPERAKSRRIEGFVTARLSISADGSVTNVEVIAAEPPGIFDREDVRAMYRYRFAAKVVGGQSVAQTATQTVEFKLK